MYLKNVSILVFAFLISSCQSFKNYDQKTYDKIGFSENDFNFTNEDTAYHRLLPSGTKIKVTNIKNREIILNNKNYKELELNNNFPLVRVETFRSNQTFKSSEGQIFEEEKKISQSIDIKNVDVVNIGPENSSNLKNNFKIIIYYGDFAYKQTALNFLNELKNLSLSNQPKIKQINTKYRVELFPMNSIRDFDLFYKKVENTKFENYNMLLR
jgi:hypothetical protein